MSTYSYSEWAALQRAERSEGEDGLHPAAKVRAFLAELDQDLHRVALQQTLRLDAAQRRDSREQFLTRMGDI